MAESIRAYFLIIAMWIRSTMVYRASFLMLTLSQFVVTGLDFITIWIMFSHTRTLGGFDLAEVAFLYGTSGVAMGTADLFVGSTERIGGRIRDGSLDVMFIRPLPVFIQCAADQFALRRLGRVGQAVAVMGWSLSALDVDWTWSRILMIPVMLISGSAIFCSIFILGAAFQFAASDASEVANAFTYGGNTLTQYPPTVFGRDLVRAVTFAVPLGFVNWMPAMHVLGRPIPLGLPDFTMFISPLVAAVMVGVAGIAWTAGMRNYRSTGS